MQLRWQWLLVADEAWWVQAAGGKLSVIPKVGFNPTVCEAVYLKYMDNVPGLSREVLWLVLSVIGIALGEQQRIRRMPRSNPIPTSYSPA